MIPNRKKFTLPENIFQKTQIDQKTYWYSKNTTKPNLISGSWDSTILQFDLNNGKFIKKVCNEQKNCSNCLKSAITSLIEFPSGKIINGYADSSIKIFDLNLNKNIATLQGHLDSVWSLLCAHSSLLISGDGCGLIKIWCLSQFICIKSLRGHTCSVNCLLLTKENIIISGSGDRTIRLWDWENCIIHLEEHSGSVHCILVLPNNFLISGSNDSEIKVWNLENQTCIKKLKQKDWIRTLVLLEMDKIICCLHNGEINLLNFELNICLKTFKFSDDSIWCTILLSNYELITGHSNGEIIVWDLIEGKCIKKIQKHSSIVNNLAIVN